MIVLGKTGFGKSLWAKLYCERLARLLVYDPSMTLRCDYVSVDQVLDQVLSDSGVFRLGTYDYRDVECFGNLSFAVGNNVLVLEEVANIFSKGLRNLPEWAMTLVFFGRHRRCSLVLIAQRAMSIPIDFRTQATRIVSFQQHEGDDLTWLKEFYGKENVGILPFLPRFTCLDYYNGRISKYSIQLPAERYLGQKLKVDMEEELVYIT